MRRVAHPYTRWEDYVAGMYDTETRVGADEVDSAYELLTDPAAFEIAMRGMLTEWPMAAEHRLSRPGAKSRSWLGAATVMWRERVPEAGTRRAWWLLTQDQMAAANVVADLIRSEWITDREKVPRA